MARSKQQLKNLIDELREWLEVNSKEHEAYPMMQEKLNKAIYELENNY